METKRKLIYSWRETKRLKLRPISFRNLCYLAEDRAGDLYWRGRKINAAARFAGPLAFASVVSTLCQLVTTVVDLGRSVGWWR